MNILKVIPILLFMLPFQLKAQTTKTRKDTIKPDTTMVVPIRKAPVDTTTNKKMPVVNPETRDTMNPDMKEMRKKEGQ